MGKASNQIPSVDIAIQVEHRRVDELIPTVNNPRTHTREQIASIAASIKEWGWTNPILIDEVNGIIAGNARVVSTAVTSSE